MMKKAISVCTAFLVTVGTFAIPVLPALTAKADASQFTTVWEDDFNTGENLSTNWNIIDEGGGFGNDEQEYYTPNNVSLTTEDGNQCLAITAKNQTLNGEPYTSGKLTTQGKHDYTYGRYEMRAKLPQQAQGEWPAFWMLPSDSGTTTQEYGGWPGSGEIDIMENVDRNPSNVPAGQTNASDPSTYYGTIHYGNPHTQSGQGYTLPAGSPTLANSWHTYAVEWLPNDMKWYIDNTLVYETNDWFSRGDGQAADYAYNAPFDKNFFMILNFAVGGSWPGDPNPSDFSNTASYPTMYVDYVKYSKYNGTLPAAGTRPGPTGGSTGTGRAPLANGNYIYNGNFATGDTTDWTFNQLDGGAGTVTVQNGVARVAATNGGTEDYSVQLLQGGLDMEPLQTYRVTFNASADQERSIMVQLEQNVGAWNCYSGQQWLGVNATQKTYSFDFTMNAPRDTNAQLEFNLGYGTIPVNISNVSVVEIDPSQIKKAAQPDGDLIYNGTFDEGANRQVFWNLGTSGGASATTSVGSDPSARQMTVNIAAAGTAATNISLYQQPFTLEKNQNYSLTFDASSTAARSITSNLADGATSYGQQSFNLTNTMTTYTYNFTMSSATDPATQLSFYLGGNANAVTLDNVTLFKVAKTYPTKVLDPNANQIANGTFDTNDDYWIPWSDEGNGVYCSSYQNNGQLEVDVVTTTESTLGMLRWFKINFLWKKGKPTT